MLLIQLFAFSLISVFAINEVTLNQYAAITEIYNVNLTNPDSVIVEGANFFETDDTVMLYQAKGFPWDYNSGSIIGAEHISFAGRWEFLIVKQIIGDTVVFTTNTLSDNLDKFNKIGLLQLIKIPRYRTLIANQGITCLPWDGKKGGVVALIADTIILNKPINVSGKGFLGANISVSNNVCSFTDTLKFRKGNFSELSVDSAGLKGESSVVFNPLYRRGQMPLFTGGGGGNGYHAGGGGGGSYSEGGAGGDETNRDNCVKLALSGGNHYDYYKKGLTRYSDYLNKSVGYRAFLGGGGGAGTQLNLSGREATKGGNGGGVVIIWANYLSGPKNDTLIIANGQSVTKKSMGAAAGGGGGGGSILLDILNLGTRFAITANGGRGGDSDGNEPGETSTGAGGGGGGGYLWTSQSTFDILNDSITSFTVGGEHGKSFDGGERNTDDGDGDIDGSNRLTELVSQSKALLFNSLMPNFNLCQGVKCPLIEGTTPKGGNKQFSYKWFIKNKNTNWQPKPAPDTLINLNLDTLSETTYIRRVITTHTPVTNIEIVDTSEILTVTVFPKISNNIISADTSIICKKMSFPVIKGNVISRNGEVGFDTIYSYQWQDSTSGYGFKNTISNTANTNMLYNAPNTDTTWFRLIVNTPICKSFSNTLKITVLPEIENNVISKSQWICEGNKPDTIIGSSRSEIKFGDGKYTIQWLKTYNLNNWPNIPDEADTAINFVQNSLTDTMWLKRVVISGNICKDTTTVTALNFIPKITNNTVSTSINKICAATPANFVGNNNIQGGDNKYYYQWLSSTDSLIWQTSDTILSANFNTDVLDTTTWFKRKTMSGMYLNNNITNLFACIDTSNILKINVVKGINNNIIFNDTSICANTNAGIIKGKTPVTTEGNIEYSWLKVNNTDTILINNAPDSVYITPVLNQTTLYARKVKSGVCSNISNFITITVYKPITGNELVVPQSVCYNSKPDMFKTYEVVEGGTGYYKFIWFFNDSANWQLAKGLANIENYTSPELIKATQFKRVVLSGNGKYNVCTDTSEIHTILINKLPMASLLYVCTDSGYNLKLNIVGNKPYTFKIKANNTEWAMETLNADSILLPISPVETSSYTLSYLHDKNECAIIKPDTISNLKAFKNTFASVSAKCGEGMELISPTNSWETFTSSNPLDVFDIKLKTITVTNYGNHIITHNNKMGSCSKSIQFHENYNNNSISVGKSLSGPYLFTSALNGTKPAKGIAWWSSANASVLFDDSLNTNTQVSGLQLGTNIIKFNYKNGSCTILTDSLIITCENIKIPEGFSPNNDKINDLFEIEGLTNISGLLQNNTAELYVFNKWGHQVYHDNKFMNNWNGSDLPEDTYFYILSAIGRTYKGFVVIKR